MPVPVPEGLPRTGWPHADLALLRPGPSLGRGEAGRLRGDLRGALWREGGHSPSDEEAALGGASLREPAREREASPLQNLCSTEQRVPNLVPNPRGSPPCASTSPGVRLCKAAESFPSLTPSPGCCLTQQGLSSAETSPKVLPPWPWTTNGGPQGRWLDKPPARRCKEKHTWGWGWQGCCAGEPWLLAVGWWLSGVSILLLLV